MEPAKPGLRTPPSQAPSNRALHPQVMKFAEILEVDAADRLHARTFWDIVEPQIGGIIERFYRKVEQSELGSYITGDTVARLKERQRLHWTRLFASQFDEDYVFSVQRVGIRHRDLKLGTAWFVAGYLALKMDFVDAVLRADLPPAEKGRILRVVEKYVALDMAIALSAYEDDSYVID